MAADQPAGTGVEWIDGQDAYMVPDDKRITRGRLWTIYLLLGVMLLVTIALAPSGGLYFVGGALVGIFLIWWVTATVLATEKE